MTTAAEIRNRAASELGILRLGQSLQNQDKERIDSAYAEVYDVLKEEGLAAWAFTGDVPNKDTPYVVGLVALNCTNTYGVNNDRYARIVNMVGVDGQAGLDKIRTNNTDEYISDTKAVDY